MKRVAKLQGIGALLGALATLSVGAIGCGPAAEPAGEIQTSQARVVAERPKDSQDAGFVSVPDQVATPAPTPAPDGDAQLFESVSEAEFTRAKPPSGPVNPAGPSGRSGFRFKRSNGDLVAGGSGSIGIPGQPAPALQQEYTWHDGDRVLTALLQPDLTIKNSADIRASESVLANTGSGSVVEKSGSAAIGGAAGDLPVFRSPSGRLMALPGGVLLALDASWGAAEVQAFFASNGIRPEQVSDLDYIANGFLIATEPGFSSLDLANSLAAQEGVEVSSPNWWREVVSR